MRRFVQDSRPLRAKASVLKGSERCRHRARRRKVRVGFIGTGAVTAYHHLPGLRLDPRAELVAICDTDAEILEKRQAEWNVEHASTDPEAVCRLDEVDAVVIATPNDTHRPIALAAARAGKHVMCEKPLGLSADEVGRCTRPRAMRASCT